MIGEDLTNIVLTRLRGMSVILIGTDDAKLSSLVPRCVEISLITKHLKYLYSNKNLSLIIVSQFGWLGVGLVGEGVFIKFL